MRLRLRDLSGRPPLDTEMISEAKNDRRSFYATSKPCRFWVITVVYSGGRGCGVCKLYSSWRVGLLRAKAITIDLTLLRSNVDQSFASRTLMCYGLGVGRMTHLVA